MMDAVVLFHTVFDRSDRIAYEDQRVLQECMMVKEITFIKTWLWASASAAVT